MVRVASRRSLVPGLLVGVLGLLLVVPLVVAAPSVPPARAATLSGYDISWPQCPSTVPPTTAQFVVIGLTRGLPFTENPCLRAQVSWAAQNGKPAQAYTFPAFPTAAQLAAYGGQGPWSASTRGGQLRNAGYAEAAFTLTSLRNAAFHPDVVWVDVEPRPAQPWPAGTAAQRENRLVVEGMLRGLHDAGQPYGLYSNQSGWQTITGDWWLPGVPVWATAGRLDYPTEAQDRCTQPSFSGGPVYLSQWWDDTWDYDMTCGSYQFTPLPMPPSSLSNSTAEWDGDWNNDILARNPATGDLLLYRGTGHGPLVQGGTVIGTGWNVFSTLDTVGDWNGDGAADVLACRIGTGDLWLYPGDGKGGWRPWSVVGVGFQGMSTLIGPGDFDGDQRPDLIAVEYATGNMYLYPGNGRGGFLPARQIGAGWYVMSIGFSPGDFNGDGNSDILAVEYRTGYLWLYPGDGHGGWLPRVRVGDGWNLASAVFSAGDFNGDGTSDVLFVEARTGYLWLYPGDGHGGWLPRVRIDSGWNSVRPIF